MIRTLRLDALEHEVSAIRIDGSNDGIDYDVVYVYCRIFGVRFGRSGRRSPSALPAAVREGLVPTCLECVVRRGNAAREES